LVGVPAHLLFVAPDLLDEWAGPQSARRRVSASRRPVLAAIVAVTLICVRRVITASQVPAG